MQEFYSNGKLLITGEYFILDGSKGLALPTRCGQDLVVKPKSDKHLTWKSFTSSGDCWLEVEFDLPRLRLVSATYEADDDGGNETLAESLRDILLAVRALNPEFLMNSEGVEVETHLTFPRDWGLGTSSTLIANLSEWAEVNPYELLKKTFGGSGYDIACANAEGPLVYKLNEGEPEASKVTFDPSFKDELYFVHLNQKQNSRAGIRRYKELRGNLSDELKQIDQLTEQFLKCETVTEFEVLIEAHEALVSKVIQLAPVKEKLFNDYYGAVKSLGAWGGDFVLATGDHNTKSYFESKGYHTVLKYTDLIL